MTSWEIWDFLRFLYLVWISSWHDQGIFRNFAGQLSLATDRRDFFETIEDLYICFLCPTCVQVKKAVIEARKKPEESLDEEVIFTEVWRGTIFLSYSHILVDLSLSYKLLKTCVRRKVILIFLYIYITNPAIFTGIFQFHNEGYMRVNEGSHCNSHS